MSCRRLGPLVRDPAADGFLSRNGYPYSYLDLDRDPSAQELLDRFDVSLDEVPIVLCPGGFFGIRRTVSWPTPVR
jgi:thioredoxin reductase (NADPH)